ncbi:MAG: TetR/AcrR family transcriptional regulator, partial [Chloroflexi bacterium]
MYENFTRLPQEEQERILGACIEEFAQHGFSQASTNAIIRKAGIPKGTLFLFSGSKKDLYLYVIDQAVTCYIQAFEQIASDPPADLFERLLYFGQARMQFAINEPLLYRLFFNAFTNTPDEIRAELQTRFAGYAKESMRRVYDGLDRTPFREGARVEQVVELVYLVLEGMYARYL